MTPIFENIEEINDIETVVLTKVRRVILQRLSKDFLLDINIRKDVILGDFVIKIIESQLALKAGSRIIKHPKNWKEAFRERWFPQWLKEYYPIKYQEYDALVMFPNLLKKYPVPDGVANQNYYFTYAKPRTVMP